MGDKDGCEEAGIAERENGGLAQTGAPRGKWWKMFPMWCRAAAINILMMR